MAALSMGAFGAYKYDSYRKYLQERDEGERMTKGPEYETVWVTKRYDPLDLRFTVPVSRHKLVALEQLQVPADPHWIPVVTDPPLKSFERQDRRSYASFPSTRCEEWSTLRQMLPSYGSAHKVHPPSWGTSGGTPPVMKERQPLRLPLVTSPMTRYSDEMKAINPHFKPY